MGAADLMQVSPGLPSQVVLSTQISTLKREDMPIGHPSLKPKLASVFKAIFYKGLSWFHKPTLP